MNISIRMDDITPDMDWAKFLRFKELCDLYQVKPLIGVVPENQDAMLHIDEVRDDFWEYLLQLEKEVSERASTQKAEAELPKEKEEKKSSQDGLSQREKEIIACVVKGMSNKEIADHLFISIHTVITHRRNIARKLEIHSPTLLTVYAIVNKLVDISEVKLSL